MKTPGFGRRANTFKFIGASIASGLIGIVFIPLLTRTLSADDFASFSKLQLYAQMLVAPSLFGISTYLTTHIATLELDTEPVSTAFTNWFVLLAILAIPIVAYGAYLGQPVIAASITLVAYARAWQSVGAQSYRLSNESGWFSVYQVGIPALFFASAISLYAVLDLDVTTVFYLGSLAYALAAAHSIRKFRRKGWISAKQRFGTSTRKFLLFASGSFLHSLAGVAVTSWDKAFIAATLSNLEFSTYIIASQYVAGLVLPYIAINQSLTPQLYKILSLPSHRQELVRFLAKVLAVNFVLFAMFELAIGPLMQAMIPPEFHSAIPIARMLGVAAFLQGLYFINSSIMFYYHRTFTLAAATMFCGTLGVALAKITDASSSTAIASLSILAWLLFFAITAVLAVYFSRAGDALARREAGETQAQSQV